MYRQAVALRLGRCGLFSAVPDTACQKNSKNQKKVPKLILRMD